MYVLFAIELRGRRVHFAGITPSPDDAWIRRVGRSLTDPVDGFFREKRFGLMDREVHAVDQVGVPQPEDLLWRRLPAPRGPRVRHALPRGAESPGTRQRDGRAPATPYQGRRARALPRATRWDASATTIERRRSVSAASVGLAVRCQARCADGYAPTLTSLAARTIRAIVLELFTMLDSPFHEEPQGARRPPKAVIEGAGSDSGYGQSSYWPLPHKPMVSPWAR